MVHLYLADLLLVLVAAMAAVLVFHRAGISSILAYLAAGLVIGPFGLGVISDLTKVEHFAEFGVVFMLFAIGLELPIQRLRTMRHWIFGLGTAQVLISAAVIAGLAALAGQPAAAAVVIGGTLALSSTATVLQLLTERGEAAARFGRVSVAVLLFQDLAVVPLLVLVPLLAHGGDGLMTALALASVKAAAVLALIAVSGRYIVRPMFQMIASTQNAEAFTAAALLLLLGLGYATAEAGMSMALGAFLAGILLAGTAYRHQIEADIQPFRGLLLGLFFMTVGMTIDLGMLLAKPEVVLGTTLGLLVVKAAVLIGLIRLWGLPWHVAVRSGLLLAQGGEFAFVVLAQSLREGLIDPVSQQVLVAAVVASIAVTPLLASLAARLSTTIRVRTQEPTPSVAEEGAHLVDHVVVAGYGRVGQTIGTVLTRQGIRWLALDLDVQRVLAARALGRPVYFGDASRIDVLRAAGIERARMAVITLDAPRLVDHAVTALHTLRPDLPILARARDSAHGANLRMLGATEAVAETVEASLTLGEHMLALTGLERAIIDDTLAALRADDYATLEADRRALAEATVRR
ncbi:MAG: monovalent cation:proton antiporter-2 (CPA2) family protein [Alphaproteobacteria bacterium]|nr:monovalent cation:proton antiporter-2 (CPA2) family protein [Alphaproteobacteria bacterium]